MAQSTKENVIVKSWIELLNIVSCFCTITGISLFGIHTTSKLSYQEILAVGFLSLLGLVILTLFIGWLYRYLVMRWDNFLIFGKIIWIIVPLLVLYLLSFEYIMISIKYLYPVIIEVFNY